MKRILFSFAFTTFLAISCLQAQDLLAFNQSRLEKQRVSMLILGSWAVGNIAIGATLGSQKTGESQYFHYMNAGWNLVNLGLATAGYLTAIKTDPATLDLYASIQEQHKLQKIFLFNAGLDVGYMAGGLYLMERSRRTENKPERLKGFGKSILLQGAFLFVFDIGAYWVQAKGNDQIAPLLEGLSFNGQSIGWTIHF